MGFSDNPAYPPLPGMEAPVDSASPADTYSNAGAPLDLSDDTAYGAAANAFEGERVAGGDAGWSGGSGRLLPGFNGVGNGATTIPEKGSAGDVAT